VRAVDQTDLLGRSTGNRYAQHCCSRVQFPDWGAAIEFEPRAAVPEVAVVEDRVDHRRGVARLDAANIDAANVEDRVGRGDVAPVGVIEAQKTGGGVYAREGGSEDARRGGDVIGVKQDRRVLIARIGHFVEREVGGLQLVVGAATIRTEHSEGRIRRHRAEPRVELVLRPAVSPGMEVAAGARLAVTANGHVPE